MFLLILYNYNCKFYTYNIFNYKYKKYTYRLYNNIIFYKTIYMY